MNRLINVERNKEGEGNMQGALHIPHEIVKDILYHLQTKSLLRFKSVCKLWHQTISDYRFVRSNNNNNKPKFIVACPFNYYCCFDFTLINPEDGHIITSCEWPWRYDEKLKKIDKSFKYHVVNSCNGLLLVVVEDKFYLWNPVTKFPIKVLEGLPFYDNNNNKYLVQSFITIIGLCHDSWKDEYKVLVKVPRFIHRRGSFPLILVCGLKEKRWKEIRFLVDDVGLSSNIEKINFNGMLHWVSSYYDTKNPKCATRLQVIMSYKPETDEIKELPKPERADKNKYFMAEIVGLVTLLGHFSLLLKMGIRGVELFSMNEYGVKDSWECMLVFEDPRCSMNLNCLVARTLWDSKMKNDDNIIDEVIVSQHSSGTEIVKFNPKMQSSERIIWLHNVSNYSNTTLSVVEYVESLVSPTGYDWSGKHHQHLLRSENIQFLQEPKEAINLLGSATQ